MELKEVLDLSENEREGGISPNVIPFSEISDLGNLLSRTGYNLTTLNMTRYSMQFRDLSQLFDYLKSIGENNYLINRRKFKSKETFIAASAIYKHLFNYKRLSIFFLNIFLKNLF
jgi:NADH dehydrogenase [ubiquinone] 1 alpha subcomplex assembly factor 5